MSTRDLNTAEDFVAVTPSDVTVFNPPFRALYVGVGGSVVIVSLLGTTATFSGVPAGTTLFIAGTQVKAASTATSIVALF